MSPKFGLEASASVIFSLFYFIFCIGFIFQFREFDSAGLSPEALLSYNDWIGSEEVRFFSYHMKKTAGTLVLQSLLPLVHLLCYSYFTVVLDHNYPSVSEFWDTYPIIYNILAVSVLIPILLMSLVWFWSLNNWSNHPMVAKLKLYARDGNWRQVGADIETEFRRIDKISLQTSPLSKLVVTDHWVVVIGALPWSLHVSHQSDVSLQLMSSEQHRISTEGHIGGAQFLHIQVQNRRADIPSFNIRLNALEYQNFQDKISGSIQNVGNIPIFKTVSERFIEVFRDTISDNPSVSVTEELEPCIGCMANTANITLVRSCQSFAEGGDGACVSCYCRPMWCVDCMAKWFASRQDQSNPENWLGSQCPCPTCRSKFCVRDVRLIV